VRWEYDIRQDGEQTSFHGSALLTDTLVLIATDNTFHRRGIGHVYAFEQESGRIRWKSRSKVGIPSDVVRAGSRACVVTLAEELIGLDLDTGRSEWTFASGAENTELIQPASPATAGECVYFGGLNGIVYALDAAAGEVIWRRPLDGRITTTPVVWRDRLYVGTAQRERGDRRATGGVRRAARRAGLQRRRPARLSRPGRAGQRAARAGGALLATGRL
jgi:outer membrane protein assembly factor BamB